MKVHMTARKMWVVEEWRIDRMYGCLHIEGLKTIHFQRYFLLLPVYTTAVPFSSRHKLNYFSFRQRAFRDSNLKLRQSRHTRLFHNVYEILLPAENSKIKKPSVEVKISNSINYLTVCC